MKSPRERLPALALAALCAAGALPIVKALVVPDVNWCYPFMTSDSYDWINNGLYWAGAPLAPSMRPPGFPLVIAALVKLGALPLLPVLNFLFLGLSTSALYLLLRERHDAWIAAASCWFFFANGYVQDFSRYVMAETYATPFLVLASLAFVRAARAPRAWIAFGLCLAAGFLFSYAAVPAAAGFGLALLAAARGDLRRKELWGGVVAAAATAGGWAAFRWSFYRAHPAGPHHGVEALLRPSLSNLTFYAFDLTALLGLVPLGLYLAGARGFAGSGSASARYRAAVLGPLIALSIFWVFLYDWTDKRFLVYVLPYLTCFLAEGLERLRAVARTGAAAAAASACLLATALLWNQIRYPSYGVDFLALSPVHFLRARVTTTSAQKAELHLDGSHVVRIHARYREAFTRGLFDPRQAEVPCALAERAYACLATLRDEADRLLPPGRPVGLFTPRAWPQDYYASTRRLANALLRPVVVPDAAEIVFEGVEAVPPGADVGRPPYVAACGPYVLARTR